MDYLRKIQVLFLLVLAGIMILTVPAFAESVQFYDSSVITGFEPADYETTVDTEFKLDMIELVKEFPTQLAVWLGGEAVYQENQGSPRTITSVSGYNTETFDVTWVCRENYEEDLEAFHFVPDFSEYKLALGLELPVITVNVEGEYPIPPLLPISEDMFPSFPVLEKEKDLTGKATLPLYHNGYEDGVLPAIRSQGSYGICWIFSSLACVEADLIHDGKANTGIDLSELHLAYYTFHNFTDEKGLNTGDTVNTNGANYLNISGNAYFAHYPLVNMLGPVPESDAPYSSAASYAPGTAAGRNGDIQVTGAYFYNIQDDRDSVKQAIMDHGAVSAVYYMDTSYYSYENSSYYYPTIRTENPKTNHVVALVGWDDNFSSSDFSSGTPEGDGAWLVRNSWGGSGYSYSSYFWMSYYDKSLSWMAVAFDAEPTRYDHIYAYDNCPDYGSEYVDTGNSVSQSFYVDGGEEIKAVGLFSYAYNTNVTVTVSCGSSSVTKDFSAPELGYYLIPLSDTLTIRDRSKVTVSITYIDGNWACYESGPYTKGGVTFDAAKGSDGWVVNGSNTEYDGKIKLFTNDVSDNPLTLTIDANKVLGYSNGISLTVDRDNNASGYGIAVYDVADNDKIIYPTIDTPVNSGNTTTIKIHGSSLVNGKVYKLSVYKYITSGSTTIKSNTVSVYGVPNTEVKQTTAQPINNGVKINSKHIAGTSGIRYYIYDASTGKQVTKVTLEGESQAATISSLENGKLYYVYSRPYTMYNDKYRWGPQSNKVYFVPVASPSGSNVVFTDPTTAVISTSANSTATGIRVLYRVTGGSLKNGCEAASNSCSIGNLSNKTAYEFYLMRYKTLNGVNHYGSGITFQYTPLVLASLAAPQDAIISYSGDTFTIKITKSGDADGISVLYRANEGNFVTGCEKASNSCTIDLDRSKSYTFYVMQYTTVDGKKTYSKGIVVKNVYGTKDASGLDIYSAVDEEIGEEMISDALSVLDESTQEEVKMLLGNEAGYELIGMDADESVMSESYASEDEMDSPDYEKDDNTPYNNADFNFVSTDGTSVVPIFMDTVQNNDDIDISNIYLVPQGDEDEQLAPNFINK